MGSSPNVHNEPRACHIKLIVSAHNFWDQGRPHRAAPTYLKSPMRSIIYMPG